MICKKLSDLMGGDISFKSSVGVGTTFRFTIRGQQAEKADEEVSAIGSIRKDSCGT